MKRVVVAIVLGALVLAAVLWLPAWALAALIFGAAAAGLAEYSRMFFADRVERWATFAAGALLALWMMGPAPWRKAAALGIVAALFALALVFMVRARALDRVAERLGLALMGAIYLGVAFPIWSWFLRMHSGRALILIAIVPACLCDVFGLVAGKAFGRHKLAPSVSPNKTVEGLAGSLVGSAVGVAAVRFAMLPELSLAFAAVLALVVWIVSPLGDLIESMLKRSCGLKDSGSVIPGHGGLLDRLDALIFTAPAAYAYFRYVVGM
ncbi:MAG: phosphatidate cytidylyltransferase [Proteobacteria bacterium]|nr:phosphatidate cytidylyltransferase [Pseudomonadota bacterium]